ncbi:hypothetical protein LJR129_000375 [Acidovorax sp. LjRoot129]|uniref:hypothetical protein n=1 Tax=Acidovorax sp. LjRoot129 TaxID=3342260 RepID=UPI003ECCE136
MSTQPAPGSAPWAGNASAVSLWAQHLAGSGADLGAGAAAPSPALTQAEAARVQRHRDQLMAALRAQDRCALLCAKQEVLLAAFSPPPTPSLTGAVGAADSPALRRALRDLSWRMAGLLLPRGARH